MTLRSMVFKNVKENLSKYSMYFLSNILVVMVFFIFANLIANPEVQAIDTKGSMGIVAQRVVYLCQFVILIFSLVFTHYSIANFLKSREKEFGLLALFGLTRGQIRGYIMLENLMVSTAAIITGLLAGILFSRLFFMGIRVVLFLEAEINFTVSLKIMGGTFLGFMALFQGISFITSFKVKNNNIVELLKGARIPRPVPRFSPFKAVFSILLIVGGYVLAVLSGLYIIFTMFPVLILVIWGTYLLYSQFAVFFTHRIQQNKGLYYRGINLITVAQIVYKLKDNAKALFIASILGAVTLTATVSVYSVQQTLLVSIEQNFPHDYDVFVSTDKVDNVMTLEEVVERLRSKGYELEYQNKALLLKAVSEERNDNSTSNRPDFYILSNSEYNLLAGQLGEKEVAVAADEVYIRSYNIFGIIDEQRFGDENHNLKLSAAGEKLSLRILGEASGGIIDDDGWKTNTAVVNDELYGRLLKKSSQEEKVIYYGYGIKGMNKASEAITRIGSIFPGEGRSSYANRTQGVLPVIRLLNLMIFIGTFISIIFFISTGSILYFKLFNEIQRDKQEFLSLKKMGMANDEIQRIVSTQCGIMFLLPFAVGLLHSVFAIMSLSNLLQNNLTGYFVFIAGIYLLLQLIYFAFARTVYGKQVRAWVG